MRVWRKRGSGSLANRMIASFAIGCAAAVGFVACGGGGAMVEAISGMAAALISYQARQPAYDDFVRLIFGNFTPTMLGGPNAYRVFFGATAFYEPPVTVAQLADFAGIPVDTGSALIAMRCTPEPGSIADPVLATWPNLIAKMVVDYQAPGQTPAPGTPDEALYMLAQDFVDSSSTVVTEPLYNTLALARQFFESYPMGSPAPQFTTAQMQKQMSTRFGTFPSFSGMGYAVEGTATSPTLSSAQIMQQMMTPEYILKNVTLAQAGCACIIVPQGAWNPGQTLDPNYIAKAGNGGGACVQVADLQ
jgi:hypothetical protein